MAPLLLGYLRGRRAREPEDLVGEVLLQVVRDLDSFGGDHRGFRSWVLAIAHHRMVDAARYHGRRPAYPVAPDAFPHAAATADPSVEVEARAGLDALLRRLDVLTDEQREILLLRVIGDLTVSEVARIVGRRPNAVTSLQHRAMTRLRHDASAAEPLPDAASGQRATRRTGGTDA